MSEDYAKTAVAYYRTSSVNGLGEDKDSKSRQQEAVFKYAQDEGLTIVREFYDEAVCGADAVGDRPAFSDMVEYMLGNGARIILVETANRFARDLIVQLTGHKFLKDRGISLIPVDAPGHFMEDTPTAVMVRQILGAVAQFERAALVEKMRKGREKKRRETGKCEGRIGPEPEVVAMARSLRAEDSRLSLRDISKRLAEAGYYVRDKKGSTGRAYGPQSVRLMLEADDAA